MSPRPFRELVRLLLALVLSGAVGAWAQTSEGIVDVPGPWSVSAGEANQMPTSGWALMKAGDRLPQPTPLAIWAQQRIHLAADHAPAAVGVSDASPLPFTVFIDDREAYRSPGATANHLFRVAPFVLPLPPGDDHTVTLRFTHPAFYKPQRLPGLELQVGERHALTLATRLRAVRDFDRTHVVAIFGVCLIFGLAGFALVLFCAQRSYAEYLWLALFCLFYGLTIVFKIRVESGALPESDLIMLVYRLTGCLAMLCSLEFVTRFARFRLRFFARALKSLLLLIPFTGLWSELGFRFALVVTLILLFLFLAVVLGVGYRRGVAEVRLLLPFLALLILVDLFFFGSQIMPSVIRLPSRVMLGTVGVGIEDLTVPLFLIAVMAVVLLRFNRVTREEQRTAAEFEAARTVQQILIPQQTPNIRGYRIASVYQPAQQVGGDFFQILPLVRGGGLFVLGDVSGKGLEAAMTVALIVGSLRTLAETTHSPAALLAGLNRRLVHRGIGFTTCLVLRLDDDGQGVAANAGHLEVYRDGAVLTLEPALPLGITESVVYTETAFVLAPGQSLTLLTDGVVEARDPDTRQLFGFDRTLASSRFPAREIADAATRFSRHGPQSDDITVLTIARA